MADSRSGESVVECVIKLLSAFERTKPRLTVSALARETSLPTSTVQRLAAELCDVGFLDRDDEGRADIGPLELGIAAGASLVDMNALWGVPLINAALNYHDAARVFANIHPHTGQAQNNPAWLVFDHTFMSKYPVAGSTPGQVPAWILQAESLDVLVKLAGFEAG